MCLGSGCLENRTCKWRFRCVPACVESRRLSWPMEGRWNVSVITFFSANKTTLTNPIQTHRSPFLNIIYPDLRPPSQQSSSASNIIASSCPSNRRCHCSVRYFYPCLPSGTCPNESTVNTPISGTTTHPSLCLILSTNTHTPTGGFLPLAWPQCYSMARLHVLWLLLGELRGLEKEPDSKRVRRRSGHFFQRRYQWHIGCATNIPV
jgi:hypothetical protein